MKLAVVAMVFLMAASAFAQAVPADASQDQGAAQPYGGPSLLSRGDDPSVLRGSDLPPLRPYLGVTGLYLSNSSGFYGYQNAAPSYGASGLFGITGIHVWSHTELDLDYHGSYRNYIPNRQDNGLDNSLNLTLKHQLTPHLSLTVTEDLARVRSFYGLPLSSLYGGGGAGFNPLYSALTGSSLTMTPSLASMGGVRMTYLITGRLSVSAGGSGIFSRQQISGTTVGSNGAVASGDIAYRLTRYQTISGGYSFTHFDYTGRFGQTDIHGLNLNYSLRLGRYWELEASGGVSRSESVGEVLDPILAQFLGVPAVYVQTHGISYMPTGSVLLTRSFHHSQWKANYDRMVLAGGGLYTTSTFENLGSTYTYSGLRRVSLDGGVGFYRFSSLNQAPGHYYAYGVSGGFGVPLGMAFSCVGRIDWRHYYLSGIPERGAYNASLGIAWRPGRLPASLW